MPTISQRLVPLLAAAAAACSSGDSSGPGGGPQAAALVLVSGDGQTAAAGTALANPIVVRVDDAQGQPLAGVAVSFLVTSGGGSVSPATTATGAGGLAQTRWSVGDVPGPNALTVRVAGLADRIVSATSVAGPPAAVTLVSGNNQTNPAGTVLPAPIVVRVADARGNRLANVEAAFAVTAGGGTLTPALDTTDAQGEASANWSLGGTPGPNGATATVAGLPPVAVSATGTIGGPARAELLAGDNQTGIAGLPLTDSLEFKVTDAAGNPVAGVQPRYLTIGSVAPGSARTRADGRLKVLWTPGASVGVQTMTVQVAGAPDIAVRATATGKALRAIAVGQSHACGIAPDGAAWCWGANQNGQLGSGQTGSARQADPVKVAGGFSFAAITAGELHTCGLTTTGSIVCWGGGAQGQIGSGSSPNAQTSPVAISGGRTYTQVSAGARHTCALDTAGAAWCWGSNGNQQLGAGAGASSNVPVAVQGGHVFSAIASGSSHTCGIENGGIFCWGRNSAGQLGDGTTVDKGAPTAVLFSTPVTLTRVVAGDRHSCALATDGTAYCWGANDTGQLGVGNTIPTTTAGTPVVGGHKYGSLAAGDTHTCGVRLDGKGLCWGSNNSAQLGDGTFTTRTVPVVVAAGLTPAAIEGGALSSCAVGTDGFGYCWGGNAAGQLGNGAQLGQLTPSAVKGP
ncbi:MAG: hypothetical protein ACOY71_08120 [Gemmatimonadota bacterium]